MLSWMPRLWRVLAVLPGVLVVAAAAGLWHTSRTGTAAAALAVLAGVSVVTLAIRTHNHAVRRGRLLPNGSPTA